MLTIETMIRRQYEHQRAKAHDFVMRELELGKRAAILFGNEADGWGPWIDTTGMFDIDHAAADTHAEWLPNPHRTASSIPRQRGPVD